MKVNNFFPNGRGQCQVTIVFLQTRTLFLRYSKKWNSRMRAFYRERLNCERMLAILNCNERLTHLRRQIITVELTKSDRTYRCKNIWCTSKGAPFKERFRQRQRRGERKGWKNKATGYNDGYCFFGFLTALRHLGYPLIHIVYVIESAAYGVIFTSCLCENPNERGTSEWGLFTQTTSEYNPVQSNFYDVSCLLHVRREFSLK